MNKKQINELLKGLNDLHPVILGVLGVFLLCLPTVVPIENKNVDNAVFIVAMASLSYATAAALYDGIKRIRKYRADEEKIMKDIENRKQIIFNKSQEIQK